MANQAIALQARAPQSDPLGGAIRNNAQMINMMAQQQAAQRQNAIAEQTMQIQRQREARETAMAGPQLAEAQSKAGSAKLEFNLKALGYAYHSAVANPSDETLDQSGAILLRLGADEMMVNNEISGIKQLPLEQRKPALMRTILSNPDSKAAFEATLPKPKEMRLGDRTLLIDENPLSSTFNQPIRTEMVGMSPAQANPTGRVVQGEDGEYYLVNTRTAGAAPVTVGGGIPGERGGADTVYGNGQYGTPPTPLSGMSVGQVQDYQRNSLIPATRGKVGAGPDKGTGAVGTYQITYGTLKDYAPKALGDNWRNTPFTADAQERVARAIYEDVKGGNLKDTWAGLPANKPGAYANVPWEQVRGQIARVESGGGAAPGQLQGPPKGSASGKAAQASAEAYNAMEAASAKYDDTIARAKRLLNNPALDTIVGNVQGNIPETALSLYSQSAANALSDYNELLAVAGFQELQAMRDASPTGGALGQVSDSENRLLQQSAFAASRTQDENKFRQSLQNYIKRLEESKRRVAGAYERTFGSPFSPQARGGQTGGAPKRLKYNPATGGFD